MIFYLIHISLQPLSSIVNGVPAFLKIIIMELNLDNDDEKFEVYY